MLSTETCSSLASTSSRAANAKEKLERIAARHSSKLPSFESRQRRRWTNRFFLEADAGSDAFAESAGSFVSVSTMTTSDVSSTTSPTLTSPNAAPVSDTAATRGRPSGPGAKATPTAAKPPSARASSATSKHTEPLGENGTQGALVALAPRSRVTASCKTASSRSAATSTRDGDECARASSAAAENPLAASGSSSAPAAPVTASASEGGATSFSRSSEV